MGYINHVVFPIDQGVHIDKLKSANISKKTLRQTEGGVCHAMAMDWLKRKLMGLPTSSHLYNSNMRFSHFATKQASYQQISNGKLDGESIKEGFSLKGLTPNAMEKDDAKTKGWKMAYEITKQRYNVKSKAAFFLFGTPGEGGHAMGTFYTQDRVHFFDPNYGEYKFKKGDKAVLQKFFQDLIDLDYEDITDVFQMRELTPPTSSQKQEAVKKTLQKLDPSKKVVAQL